MELEYNELFRRNFGIFTADEQEKIKKTKVLIIGCGGIGGTVAIILARCGVTNFTLVDFDNFDISNMNRQICCFTDTLGQKKTEVTKSFIEKINPEAKVTTYTSVLDFDQIEVLCKEADIIFPAADDLPYSVTCFKIAKKVGKPALLIIPSGFWSAISLIKPENSGVEDLFGIPKGLDYEQLKKVLSTPKYKLATYFYIMLGGWQRSYYRDYIEKDLPLTQICPSVWIASSIGALELIKFISGRKHVVALPRYWWITKRKISIQRLYRFNFHTLLVIERKIFWGLFHTPFAPILKKLELLWWKIVR